MLDPSLQNMSALSKNYATFLRKTAATIIPLYERENVARQIYDACALRQMDAHIHTSYTLLHNSTTNTATTTSSATTLKLRRSNSDGCTWPRKKKMNLIG